MEDRHPGWPRIWILESRAGGWSRAKGNKPSPTWQRDRQIWEGNLPKGGWRGAKGRSSEMEEAKTRFIGTQKKRVGLRGSQD